MISKLIFHETEMIIMIKMLEKENQEDLSQMRFLAMIDSRSQLLTKDGLMGGNVMIAVQIIHSSILDAQDVELRIKS
jgi:hypothetical protein